MDRNSLIGTIGKLEWEVSNLKSRLKEALGDVNIQLKENDKLKGRVQELEDEIGRLALKSLHDELEIDSQDAEIEWKDEEIDRLRTTLE